MYVHVPFSEYKLPAETEIEGFCEILPFKKSSLGKGRGIQGDTNSCYMDVTLFCMFAFNDTFDGILKPTVKEEDRPFNYQDIHQTLKNKIVNPLRKLVSVNLL